MEIDLQKLFRKPAVASGAVVLLGAFAVVAILWGEHKLHIVSALPFLLILLCPAMHLFMHGKHGKHGEHGKDQ